MNKNSILEMAHGAFLERADYELAKVVDNILDLNTKPTGKRSITLTLTLVPDESRSMVQLSVQAKTKLVPTDPVSTVLCFTADQDGVTQLTEMVPEIPGQTDLMGGEQSEPAVLKFLKQA